MPSFPDEKNIWAALRGVIDPETHLNIVDMGLIYSVRIENSAERIFIDYTLTTPLCPLAGVIQENIRTEVAKNFPYFSVTPESLVLQLVFDPPWTRDRLSAEAKAELGL